MSRNSGSTKIKYRGAAMAAALLGFMFCTAASADSAKIVGIYRFLSNASNPLNPTGGLAQDAKGNLFGVVFDGGHGGAVFELSPNPNKPHKWTRRFIHEFKHPRKGTQPSFRQTLAIDKAGNLYGTTSQEGVVFKLSPPATAGGNWPYQVLHSMVFADIQKEGAPSGVMLDKKGNLFGTTVGSDTTGFSVAFELTPPTDGGNKWAYSTIVSLKTTTILSFINSENPQLGFYGTVSGNTDSGGSTHSSIYTLTPPSSGDGKWTQATISP